MTWHNDVYFGMHYDLHAREDDTELGARLTHENLREQLEKVRPDWIQCDCKGHPGWTSWPSDMDCTSPGVVRDALRIHRDVTSEMGIRLGMHYSGVMDRRQADLHPDWLQRDAEGTPDPRGAMCRLGPYLREFLIPHLLEIVEKYDVDGFWVDGENWACGPCWCERCVEAFMQQSGADCVPTEPGQEMWDEWLAFHRQVFFDYVKAYADAVHARKADCAVCSNWLYTLRTPDPVEVPVDYLSGDYVLDYGADRAALEGRFLDGRPLSWDLMAWAFSASSRRAHLDGIYQLKNATHMKQEVAVVVALGGAVMLYVQPMRDGRLVGWHHDMFAEVAQFCREHQEACFQTQTLPQAAIVHPAASFYADNAPLFNFGHAHEPIEGALHALLETHRSTDILSEERALERMGEYPLVVVPERIRLSEQLTEALERYAREGGQVLMSGAHLAHETPDLVGADPAEGEALDAIRLAVGERAIRLGGTWRDVAPRRGVEALAKRLWSDEPTDVVEAGIVATRRTVGKKGGAICAVHGPLFQCYFVRSYPLVRRWIADLVGGLGVDWALEAQGAPPWLEFVLRRKGDRTVVNMINRGASETLSPNRPVLEEIVPVCDVKFRLRLDRAPHSVSLAPGGERPEWSYCDGWCQVDVPVVEVMQTVVFE